MSEHAFLSVVCRDDIKEVCSHFDRHINWMSHAPGKSPLVQLKEPYANLDMVVGVQSTRQNIVKERSYSSQAIIDLNCYLTLTQRKVNVR